MFETATLAGRTLRLGQKVKLSGFYSNPVDHSPLPVEGFVYKLPTTRHKRFMIIANNGNSWFSMGEDDIKKGRLAVFEPLMTPKTETSPYYTQGWSDALSYHLIRQE